MLDRLDDRLNPIVVKELRQAVRAHGLLGLLAVVMVGEVVIVAMALRSAQAASSFEAFSMEKP